MLAILKSRMTYKSALQRHMPLKYVVYDEWLKRWPKTGQRVWK